MTEPRPNPASNVTITKAEAEKVRQELNALADRAQQGDRSTLPRLREVLQNPRMVDMLGGDLAKVARDTLIEKFSDSNLLLKESLTRKVELLLAEVAGPSPAPLEKLLASRVVSGWLHLHHLEQIYAQKGSMSLDLGTYYQRSLDRAQKRYLAAIKALALVRKLALPVLQVNIARKQVNVAGSVNPPDQGRSH